MRELHAVRAEEARDARKQVGDLRGLGVRRLLRRRVRVADPPAPPRPPPPPRMLMVRDRTRKYGLLLSARVRRNRSPYLRGRSSPSSNPPAARARSSAAERGTRSSGIRIEMNAPAGSSSAFCPNSPVSSARALVIGAAAPLAKISATSRSFQTQRNWKIANDAIAGSDSGSTMRKKICPWLAPSTRAASITSAGISRDEVVQQEDRQRQREDRVRDPHLREQPGAAQPLVDRVAARSATPREKSDSSGTSAIWIGTICSANTSTKMHVAALELHPRERVPGEGRDHEREDGRRDRDRDRVEERPEQAVAPEQHVLVVLERDGRVDEDLPPAGAQRVDLRPDRREEQPDGRDRPEHRDDQRCDGRAAAGEPLLGAARRRLDGGFREGGVGHEAEVVIGSPCSSGSVGRCR